MKNWIVLLLLLASSACKTPQKTQITNESFRFIEREVRDTTLFGMNVKTELSMTEILERPIHDTIKITDPKTKGELLLWKNKYGELVAQCTSQDQKISRLEERIRDYESKEVEKITEVDPRTWWQKLVDFVPWYVFLIAGFAGGLILRIRLL